MQVKPGKYKTRDGHDAVVLTVDAPVTYGKVIVYIIYNFNGFTESYAMRWEDNGMFCVGTESADDLVEYICE